MSDAARAHIGYGFNLGSPGNGGWKLHGAGEFGEYEFSWSSGGYSFDDDAYTLLGRAALPVEVKRTGHHEVPGYVLIADGSKRSVEWTDTLVLDPAELAAERTKWDGALDDALVVLGITPIQDGPAWLVFPSYG